MGTRSFIAIRTDNGFKGVYCHWDGYLEHNGEILFKYYSTYEQAEQLINMGGISSLKSSIGKQHSFDNKHKEQETNPELKEYTTFYHRDRGEQLSIRLLQNEKGLLNAAENCGAEFLYVHDGQVWRYAERGSQYFGMSNGEKFSNMKFLSEGLKEIEEKAKQKVE